MAYRASKRPKIEKSACTRGEDDYLPGNIIEIEIHNFMTYDHLKCKPGSRLNLVIGPNGSGKSSIVCAIALGLGGDPQILGRAGSIGAFVKRGEDSGYIKISLRGDTEEEKIVIMRKIDIHNKSEWALNGVSVPKRDVLGIIERFNIQVNNLTQFLPQDRVCEFAKLSPIQLLEETEKAVGDAELPVQHQTLIETSKQVKKLEMTIKQNQETLKYLKDQHAEQEKDVERVRQREKLLKKVDLMKKKMPWLKYDMKRMEYEEAKRREAEAKKKLDQVARTLNELKGPVEEHKKVKQTHETAMKKLSTQITQNANKRAEVFDMDNMLVVQVHGKYTEMDELKKQEESRLHRIENAKKELHAAETELANLPVYEPPTAELETLRSDILELNMNQNQVKSKKKERENLLSQTKLSLRKCLDRLTEMENYKYKLLQALRNNGADKIVEAHKWLQEHRNDLQKEVFGPVLLDVTVPNPAYASYLESQVPNYIWKSFIAQDPADRDYLVRNLKQFDIPVLNFVESRDSRTTPFQLSHAMHELGIETRLDQVFEAPDAVKKVLISQAGLENSYIGSHQADRRAGEVPDLGIMDLWTPGSHYKWSVSRYGGHKSTIVDPVHSSRLFACSVDAGDIESLKATKIRLEQTISELEGNVKELQAQEREIVQEEANLQKQREKIIEAAKVEKKKRRDMENFVGQKRLKVESISKEDGIELSTKRLCDEVARLSNTRHQNAIKIKTLLIEAVAFKWSFSSKQMMAIELDAKIREMEIGLKQHEKSALAVASLVDTCKTETKMLKDQLDNLRRHAESFATITVSLAREFEKMPGTVEELEAAIQDGISEANSILFLNQNILQEYESRKDKIADLVAKVEADQGELDKHRCEIQILKEKWLLRLQDLVVKINDTFSRNFQEMAVAGEVSLDEHGMDFDQYGILIKVKFRQSGLLQVLSAHHQSGGERSVSTILYLVSLQDLTNCPFRVVDEINQGMDPINERKMFQQLVRAASQLNTPQCFLLTPKLLPDLEYSDACSILNIMNGPWIDKPAKVWSSGQNWGMVMGLTQLN